MGLATIEQVYCDCLDCNAGKARREVYRSDLRAEPVRRHSFMVWQACLPKKTDGDATPRVDVEKATQGAVLRWQRRRERQRRSNPQTRFMGGSELNPFETLTPASRVKRMMGPSKACVADTPRLAARRIATVPVSERARSQRPWLAHPIVPTPHANRSIGLHAPACRTAAGCVDGGRAPQPLPHAPLLH